MSVVTEQEANIMWCPNGGETRDLKTTYCIGKGCMLFTPFGTAQKNVRITRTTTELQNAPVFICGLNNYYKKHCKCDNEVN